jgi:plastocyanin
VAAPRAVIRAIVIAAALGLTAVAVSPAAPAPVKTPVTHTVTIDATSFQPAKLTIEAGDRVVWINKDLLPHTATSRAAGFDSQVIAAGKSWATTPSGRGSFQYVCLFHPTMVGMLEVR